MLDLESAIKHCEEVANGMTAQGECEGCAEDHRQLAEWLKELKQLRKSIYSYPQPKMGRWIRVDKDKLRCSECEVIHLIAQYPIGKINWCPNCGAKLIGVLTAEQICRR